MKRFNYFLTLCAVMMGIAFSSIARAAENAAGKLLSPGSHVNRVFLNARVMFTTAWEGVYRHVFAPVLSYALASTAPSTGAIPSVADFQRARVTDRNQSEIIGQPLYDWQLYPAAGQQQFTFFQNPIGQGITSTPGAVVGTAKTISDTNMRAAGQLPSGMEFLIESIEVYFQPGSSSTANTFTPAKLTTDATGVLSAAAVSAVNDIQQVYNEGTLSMLVLQKPQFTETPLRRFPPANWIEVDAALATTATTTSLAVMNATPKGDLYVLKAPISLQSVVNFNITIDYPAARSLPSTFNGRIGVYLNGYMLRAAQ